MASLKITPLEEGEKPQRKITMVALTELDPRINDDVRVQPCNETKSFDFAGEGKNTKLGTSFPPETELKIQHLLKTSIELFGVHEPSS